MLVLYRCVTDIISRSFSKAQNEFFKMGPIAILPVISDIFVAAIITNSISMKCAMRITSCKPALCEWCAFKVLHLSAQAAPWVVSNEWWEIFPSVQCCFAGKSHRGSDDDMSCSYVKKFRDSRLLTMLTRAHARTHQTPSTCSFA